MGATYRIKRNDTLPKMEVTLVDSSGAAIDLSSVNTVTLLLKRGSATFSDSMVVTNDVAGEVEWQAADGDWTTLTKGMWNAEIELVYSSGDVLTVPTVGYISVSIEGDLGDTP